jgi:hypothetical protein
VELFPGANRGLGYERLEGREASELYVTAFGFELTADEVDVWLGQDRIARAGEDVREGLWVGKADRAEFAFGNPVARYGEHRRNGVGFAGLGLEPVAEGPRVIRGLLEGVGFLAPWPDDLAAVKFDFVWLSARLGFPFPTGLGFHNPDAPGANSDVVDVELTGGTVEGNVMVNEPAGRFERVEAFGDIAFANEAEVIISAALKPGFEEADRKQEEEGGFFRLKPIPTGEN